MTRGLSDNLVDRGDAFGLAPVGNVAHEAHLLPQQRLRELRGGRQMAISLDHNGVPLSLGSRRQDKLTCSNLVCIYNAQ